MGIITVYSGDVIGTKAKVKDLMQREITQFYENSVNMFNNMYGMVWTNQWALTPQQVLDSFGTDATQLFQLAGILAQMVNSITPGALNTAPPAGKMVTFNPDGTVTVTG